MIQQQRQNFSANRVNISSALWPYYHRTVWGAMLIFLLITFVTAFGYTVVFDPATPTVEQVRAEGQPYHIGSVVNHWAARNYTLLVRHWYWPDEGSVSPQEPNALVAKFPMFPAMLRVGWLALRQPDIQLVVAVGHLLMVYFFLAETFRFWSGKLSTRFARDTLMWYFAAATFGLGSLTLVYDEALFIGLMWLSLGLYQRGSRWSGVALMILTLTRPIGIVLAGLIGLDLLWQQFRTRQRFDIMRITAHIYPLVTYGWWMIHTSLKTDLFLAPIAMQAIAWDRRIYRPPPIRYARVVEANLGTDIFLSLRTLLDVAFIVTIIALIILFFRARPTVKNRIPHLIASIPIIFLWIGFRLHPARGLQQAVDLRFGIYIVLFQGLVIIVSLTVLIHLWHRRQLAGYLVIYSTIAIFIPWMSFYGSTLGRMALATQIPLVMPYMTRQLPKWAALSLWAIFIGINMALVIIANSNLNGDLSIRFTI